MGKVDLFWVPKPEFDLHSGDTLALKKMSDHSEGWFL